MKKAKVFVDSVYAGHLIEVKKGLEYRFEYLDKYLGSSVSLTMPLDKKVYLFDRFPPFFEGLLPEGGMLEALLKRGKIDDGDLFEQLIRVGKDMVGNVTVERAK
jgi:serine/threonine-protein kinase HipA